MNNLDEQYAIGFVEGETQRFLDKRAGIIRARPHPWMLKTIRSWGFWDGYTPRSSEWARGEKTMAFETVEC